MICENMLMAEGFISAKSLSKKFFTLYFLCKDLLSKAAHYDWGLRAIKSVLVVAGDMLRKNNDPNIGFEGIIEKVTIANGLHPDETFLRKVVELGELLEIRHCVFTMGPPGAGKSSTWKTLASA